MTSEQRLGALLGGPPPHAVRLRRIEDLEEASARIREHDRYYPVESNLPIDPATGGLLEMGLPWRLRVAWGLARRYAIDEAHLRMRAGVIRLDAAHGLVETLARGYHETLTRAWLILIERARGARPACESSRAFLAEHAASLAKDAPLAWYSRARLFSPEARARYLEPDLATFT